MTTDEARIARHDERILTLIEMQREQSTRLERVEAEVAGIRKDFVGGRGFVAGIVTTISIIWAAALAIAGLIGVKFGWK